MKSIGAPPFAIPGRYAYDNKTLAGGQGAVYICRDVNLNRRVAVKALHTVSNAKGLLKEVEARAKIKSKHVAELYEVLFTSSGKPLALVIEYIPGETLQDKSTIPPELDRKLLLLYQLACGLDEIHAAGVIHRDIKPQNMKVDAAGVLKIFDLGIANLDADSASTIGGAGTLLYRAPELYATPPVAVTRAADIYAFGVVAWHALATSFPPPLLEIPPQQSGVSLPSLSTVVPGLGSVAALIDRTLKIDPNNRPSAAEISNGLRMRLTRGRQRGVFAYGEQTWHLASAGKATTLNVSARGKITVAYDGDAFVVREVSGDVFINNTPATVNYKLPASCVLTFGSVDMGASRAFIPFNASRPEIVL